MKLLVFPRCIILAQLLTITTSALASKEFRDFPHSQARIISQTENFHPENGILLGLEIKLEDEWHSYWKNPGDSGAPPQIAIEANVPVEMSEIQYETPKRIYTGPLTSYGYEKSVLYAFRVVPKKPIPSESNWETISIQLNLEWLVCKVECIPAFGDFTVDLTIARKSTLSEFESIFLKSAKLYPKQLPENKNAKYNVDLAKQKASLHLPDLQPGFQVLDFFIDTGNPHLSHAKPLLEGNQLQFKLADQYSNSPNQISGLLIGQHQNGNKASFMISASTISNNESEVLAKEPLSLLLILTFAFVGGVILNLMPCVLPILSIKIISLVQLSQKAKTHRLAPTIAYVSGILISFCSLAMLLWGLRSSGEMVGWGFQLQNPIFNFLMICLFFAIGCNLMGFFELHFSAGIQGKLGENKSKGAMYLREMLEGFFAVLVASPCTAPFMGAAIGASLSLPLPMLILVFLMLGLGFASPYLLFLIIPDANRFFPKPGQWMNTLRQLLAFPMFGAVIWLLWVLEAQIESSVILLGLGGLLTISFCIWLSKSWKKTGVILGILAVVAFGAQIQLSAPVQKAASQSQSKWKPFNPDKLEELIKKQAVFIDFTAKWCITCQVNKKMVFETAEIQDFFESNNINLMVADWTNYDPQITKILKKHNRAGVPMYLFYNGQNPEPKVLPEVLTPSILKNRISKHLSKE